MKERKMRNKAKRLREKLRTKATAKKVDRGETELRLRTQSVVDRKLHRTNTMQPMDFYNGI